jgi:hypothetical protein
MGNILNSYREWDGSLGQILDYFWSIAVYMWNIYGIIGVAVAVFLVLAIGIKSEDFGHVFSLITASLVRSIGGTVGFVGTIIQKIALFVGGQASQAVVREYVDKFKGITNNAANAITKDEKKE